MCLLVSCVRLARLSDEGKYENIRKLEFGINPGAQFCTEICTYCNMCPSMYVGGSCTFPSRALSPIPKQRENSHRDIACRCRYQHYAKKVMNAIFFRDTSRIRTCIRSAGGTYPARVD